MKSSRIITFLLIVIIAFSLVAARSRSAQWERALNRWAEVVGLTSSKYLGIDQLADVLIDSDGHVNDVYLDAATLGVLTTATNVGTASDSVTVVEYGYGDYHKTVITVDTHFGAIVGGTELALGSLLYTFPDSIVVVHSTYMGIILDEIDGNITADTPDLGIGTTIGSGAHDLLSEVGGSENMLTGQTVASCDSVWTYKCLATSLVSEQAGAKTVYLNIADDWAASGEAALAATGTVIIEWYFVKD